MKYLFPWVLLAFSVIIGVGYGYHKNEKNAANNHAWLKTSLQQELLIVNARSVAKTLPESSQKVALLEMLNRVPVLREGEDSNGIPQDDLGFDTIPKEPAVEYAEAFQVLVNDQGDAEEVGDKVYLTSDDLEMGCFRDNDQFVGLRFTGIQIPKKATITEAFLEFTVKEASTGPIKLHIKAEKGQPSSPFADTPQNLSSRELTEAFAEWEPADWNTVGERVTTSKLRHLIQEVVNDYRYDPGDPFALYIYPATENQGVYRSAKSAQAVSTEAPKLVIRYEK